MVKKVKWNKSKKSDKKRKGIIKEDENDSFWKEQIKYLKKVGITSAILHDEKRGNLVYSETEDAKLMLVHLAKREDKLLDKKQDLEIERYLSYSLEKLNSNPNYIQ